MKQTEKERQLRENAHRIWEHEDRPEGRGLEHWLRAEQALGRNYGLNLLPVFRELLPPEVAREIRLKLYGEVCSAWRMLTDVRFKLLAAVPAVSGAALYGLFALNPGVTDGVRMWACVAGFFVTFGLYLYDKRNSELYDDLISRGRRIEHELGVDTGLFRGRKGPSSKWAQHDTATGLIYGTALVVWELAARYFLFLVVGPERPVADHRIVDQLGLVARWIWQWF